MNPDSQHTPLTGWAPGYHLWNVQTWEGHQGVLCSPGGRSKCLSLPHPPGERAPGLLLPLQHERQKTDPPSGLEGQESKSQAPDRAYHRNSEALKLLNFLLYTVKVLHPKSSDSCFSPCGWRGERNCKLLAVFPRSTVPASRTRLLALPPSLCSGGRLMFLTSLLIVSSAFLWLF